MTLIQTDSDRFVRVEFIAQMDLCLYPFLALLRIFQASTDYLT